MILANAFGIQSVPTGTYLAIRFLGHRREGGSSRYEPSWVEDPFKIAPWPTEARVEKLLEQDFNGKPFDGREYWRVEIPSIMVHSYSVGWEPVAEAVIEKVLVRKVRLPACGCCGANPLGRDAPKRPIRQVDEGIWRCEKHVGRNPCCIEGCGKTFALKPDQDGRGAEDYSWRIMCGKCWRQAPKWMRDRVSKIRRLARRRGWTDQISRLHGMAWEACHRAIVEGRRLDQTEINKLFGWDE